MQIILPTHVKQSGTSNFFLEDRNINKAFALSVLRLLHFEPATAFNLPLLLILYETALVRKTSL